MFAVRRLTAASLRGRPGTVALVTVVFALVSAVACVGLAVDDSAARAWDTAFERTRGAHVRYTAPTPEAGLAIASGLPGVSESSEPWATAFTQLRAGGRVVGLGIILRTADAAVDRPLPVEGAPRDGPGLLIERSFASALRVRAGDAVEIRRPDGSWAPTLVRGVAASVVAGPYPSTVPGRAFATPDDAALLGLTIQPARTVAVRLHDPAAAARVATQAGLAGAQGPATVWSADRADALGGTRDFQVILSAFALLLLAGAASVLATTIGGRLVAEQRQLGLLRAAGCTPGHAAAAVVLEYALMAAVGSAVGVVIAALTLPSMTAAALPPLGVPPGGLGVENAVGVVVTVTAIAALVAAGTATRAARRRPATLLYGEQQERNSRLGRWSLQRGVPITLVLGAKDAFARRSRAVTTAGAVALVVMASIAALHMEATFRKAALAEDAGRSAPTMPARPGARPEPLPGLAGPLPLDVIGDEATVDEAARLRPLVYGLEALLIATALVNLLVSTQLDARERRREQAMLKALGVTPVQLSASRGIAACLVAAGGSVIGLPLGWAFFRGAYAAADGTPAEIGDASYLAVVSVVGSVCLLAGAVAALAAHKTSSQPAIRSLTIA